MKKGIIILIWFVISIISYGEIKVSVHEHMKFKEINTRSIGQNIVGEGKIEIQADEEDIGKIIELTFLKKGMMTNRRNIIPVENFSVEEEYEKFELKGKTTIIKFYGTIDKRKIAKRRIAPEMIEGQYLGGMPIMVSVYEKEKTKDVK